jgi:hypothetical protein
MRFPKSIGNNETNGKDGFRAGNNERSKAMAKQQLTYKGVLKLFMETREQMKETSRKIQEVSEQIKETARLSKETDKKISALGSRIGEIIESMVEGGVVDKFQALDYEITQCARDVKFGSPKSDIRGEIDLFLENGDIAILIEVKTTLGTADVRKHIERLKKYRRYADEKRDKRRFIGAVAGAVVKGEAREFALKHGMYVIVQSGNAVEIVPLPKDFRVKEW